MTVFWIIRDHNPLSPVIMLGIRHSKKRKKGYKTAAARCESQGRGSPILQGGFWPDALIFPWDSHIL